MFPEKGNMGKVLPEYLSNWTTEKVKKGQCPFYFVAYVNFLLFFWQDGQRTTLLPINNIILPLVF